jgi:hypothetical protein
MERGDARDRFGPSVFGLSHASTIAERLGGHISPQKDDGGSDVV